MEVQLALNGVEELMDLPLEAGLEPPSWSPSETHSPNSDILEELHPWTGEVKVCGGLIFFFNKIKSETL
ncbi:hypothetical protein ONE63_004906 [Megalurothrips usitatus]|uniref:Uncharacterized protein n=1 Tax=Megalurothrips usitatus TaxID=439358 RepID=A0AAV7X4I7_9NEOP|nr:hypothetical protein ONE63_004906 [Megalurothrips usitatus]